MDLESDGLAGIVRPYHSGSAAMAPHTASSILPSTANSCNDASITRALRTVVRGNMTTWNGVISGVG
jgi:hypothetical protein